MMLDPGMPRLGASWSAGCRLMVMADRTARRETSESVLLLLLLNPKSENRRLRSPWLMQI